jgi:hypothetical protein
VSLPSHIALLTIICGFSDIELENPSCKKGKSGATDSLVEDRKSKISRMNFKRRFFLFKIYLAFL